MEQNRLIHIWSTEFSQSKGNSTEKGSFLQQMVLEQLNTCKQKEL